LCRKGSEKTVWCETEREREREREDVWRQSEGKFTVVISIRGNVL